MVPRDLLLLAAMAGGTLLLGFGSGLFAAQTASDYAQLEGPSWAPPSWLFGPVWSVLYIAIGTSLWLAWRAGARGPPIALWGAQLVLNLLWTPLFFGLGWRGAALVDILLLDAVVVATALSFAKFSRAAAWLLVPYLAWILFASALNAAYWWMN